ncbi:MAG: ankyrin repeat domain-containing protein [Casimicrobiaceae bacterium]
MTADTGLRMFLLLGCGFMLAPAGLAVAAAPEALHDAVVQGDLVQLDALLTQGADANAPTQSGRNTALHLAALLGNGRATELLLQNGAQPDARNAQGHTPLHWAALCVMPEAASAEGRARVIKLLLDRNADPNRKDDHGQTPLHWALQRTVAADVADYFLGFGLASQGQKTSPSGGRPAVRCRPATIVALAGRRADLYARTSDGTQVIDLAIASRQPELVRQLLDSGLNLQKTSGGGDKLMLAAARADEPAIVRLLVEHGISVRQRDEDGNSALHVAASAGFAGTVTALLDAGAEVNARNARGDTPLDLASVEAVRIMLRARGAKTGHPLRLHVRRQEVPHVV